MRCTHCLTIGMLALLPLAAIAQQPPQKPDPMAKTAAAPALTYVSAFRNDRDATDEELTPDKAWRAANDEVARLGGHGGHIQRDGQAEHGKHHQHHQSEGIAR